MSYARGERVYLDLESDLSEQVAPNRDAPPAPASTNFIRDILEHDSSSANPPSAPSLKSNATGFPAHKKRTNRVSAFKQQRASKNNASLTSQLRESPNPTNGGLINDDEKRRIDQDNRQRIADMSPKEIEEEQKELFSTLSPGLIQKLLARANIDDGSNERDLGLESPPTTDEKSVESKSPSIKKVSFDTSSPQTIPSASAEEPESSVSATVTSQPPSTETDSDAIHPDLLPSSIHFPKPPQPPDLDPTSSTFLTDLHEKYFPDLPYDPSTVSWMTPIDLSDTTSPYHPSQSALNASELRFDFKGALLAPSSAREIPVTKGLHHHGDAPEAAGYTIPELARLARSAVASQRCVAYQTLGRILYRLGKGEFGEEQGRQRVDGPAQIARDPNQASYGDAEEESVGSAMATGLWNCIEEGRVIETLTEEAKKERGHLTARTYAQEALWNWRRGGGRRRKAV
ncbi:hypothetical protein K469DRAFT_678808 [Zopfia rhizophila CBS 207.26]|uniref:Transcription factor Rba50 n=1 Tax=Zopfia rhizophila CBS 207.26 TaxID=1314779 RepID=A0A6A6DBI7_9PEZI|nr:hypothetical protein K469DRAFT_678808 [Zopfia rhizophila CBS 207.26]